MLRAEAALLEISKNAATTMPMARKDVPYTPHEAFIDGVQTAHYMLAQIARKALV